MQDDAFAHPFAVVTFEMVQGIHIAPGRIFRYCRIGRFLQSERSEGGLIESDQCVPGTLSAR